MTTEKDRGPSPRAARRSGKTTEVEGGAAVDVQARLAAIVELSEDAIIEETVEGTITSWNPAARRLYGYSADEAVGRPISIIFPPNRPGDLAFVLQKIRRGERMEHHDCVQRRKDGSRVHALLAVSPIWDRAGRVVGAITTAHDVTDLDALQEEREEMIRAISHDLRGPLTAVQGQAQMLMRMMDRSGQDERMRQSAEAIFASARRMDAMIRDLVDRVRSEPVQLKPQELPQAAVGRRGGGGPPPRRR